MSYFTPMKYVGIWWEMHIGKSTWDMEGSQDMSTYIDGQKGSARHGATTENAMRYIDFAAANGIKGLLVEGWNTGWDQWINTTDREGVFDQLAISREQQQDIKYVVLRVISCRQRGDSYAWPCTMINTAFVFTARRILTSSAAISWANTHS